MKPVVNEEHKTDVLSERCELMYIKIRPDSDIIIINGEIILACWCLGEVHERSFGCTIEKVNSQEWCFNR